jgi:hypothetical protein
MQIVGCMKLTIYIIEKRQTERIAFAKLSCAEMNALKAKVAVPTMDWICCYTNRNSTRSDRLSINKWRRKNQLSKQSRKQNRARKPK